MNDTITSTEVTLPGPVEPSGLLVGRRELDRPGPGRVVVRMEATGVSFAEQQMRRGSYFDQPPFPFVPGYDLVGTVVAVGPGVDSTLIGQRFAAVTKVGAWASHLIVDAADLLPVPEAVSASAAASLVVNGITAWQLLHRTASVPDGGTVVVLGANGGVGSTLVQLARIAGLSVIGTASARHHATVRSLGAEPVDYRDPDLYERIRELAPHGVDAVFDHVGGPGLVDSWRLLRRGGTLVSYGSASTKDRSGNARLPILASIARLAIWNLLPNGKHAHFYNFWQGSPRPRWRQGLRDALGQVLARVADGQLDPRIAAEFPLSHAAGALELAESHTVAGKIILLPDGAGSAGAGSAGAGSAGPRSAGD